MLTNTPPAQQRATGSIQARLRKASATVAFDRTSEPASTLSTSQPSQPARQLEHLAGTPRILVLLASFNGGDWILQQLQSILAQRNVRVDVILRDDCSTDSTVAAACRAATEGNVMISAAATPSGSASQNFFKLIRDNSAHAYDYVAFADQDDVWKPDKLARACTMLRESGSVGYSSAVTAVWADGKRRLLRQAHPARNHDFLFEGAGQGCTFVLTATFYQAARKFIRSNPSIVRRMAFHDWTIYALARSRGLTWTFDPRSGMEYRQHNSNSLGARTSIQGMKRRLFLIRSGWYKAQLTSIAELCVAAAPSRAEFGRWQRQLLERDSWSRRFRLAKFCALDSRRSRSDRMMLALSAVAGWI